MASSSAATAVLPVVKTVLFCWVSWCPAAEAWAGHAPDITASVGMPARGAEFVFFTFLFIWTEFCVFLYIKGLLSREYLAFGLFMLLYAPAFCLDSQTFSSLGFSAPASEAIALSLYRALPASILHFQSSVYGKPLNAWTRLNVFILLALAFATPVVASDSAERTISALWLVICLSSATTALVLAVRAWKRRLNESSPMLAGMLWLCLAGGASLAVRVAGYRPFTLFGLADADVVLLVWIIVIKYGVIARFARVKAGMRRLSARLLSAHEEERRRLARDLHDGMGQNLLAVRLNLQRFNKDLKNRQIDGIIEELSGSINEMRDITAGLMPVSLHSMGLGVALKTHAAQYSKKTGIDLAVEADDLPRLLPANELSLYRVFQEALNNAAKHSGASCIKASLRDKGAILVLEVRDDGRGFDVLKTEAANRGMGLSIMRERARIMGGALSVDSGDNQGTIIRVEVPAS